MAMSATEEFKQVTRDLQSALKERQDMGESFKSIRGTVEDLEKRTKEIVKSLDEVRLAQAKYAPTSESGARGTVTPDTRAMIDHILKRGASISNPVTGGYLAVPDFVARVEKKFYDDNPIMNYVEVINTTGDLTELPFENTRGTSHWVGETESRNTDDSGTLGIAKIPVNEIIAKVKITNRMMENSIINMEQYFINQINDQIGYDIGLAMVSGNGFNKPKGVFVESLIATKKSGSASAVSFDAALDMLGAVKKGVRARARFYGNIGTYVAFAKLKGADNYYLQPSPGAGLPPTFYGYEYVELPDAPAIASAAKPLIFGDMYSAYKAVRGSDLKYQMDEYTDADNGNYIVRFRQRMGGQVVVPSSLVALKMEV